MEPTPALRAFLLNLGYVALPLKKSPLNHFELRGTLNNQPVLLMLDTGASHTGLDEQSAERLHLLSEASDEKAGGLGNSEMTVSQCVIDTLTLGELRFESVPAFVADLSHVNAALAVANADSVDGILGADLLNHHGAIIDYGSSTLYLKP